MLVAAKAVYDAFLPETEVVDFKCPVFLTLGEHDKTGYVQRYNRMWAVKTGYPLKIIKAASTFDEADVPESLSQKERVRKGLCECNYGPLPYDQT